MLPGPRLGSLRLRTSSQSRTETARRRADIRNVGRSAVSKKCTAPENTRVTADLPVSPLRRGSNRLTNCAGTIEFYLTDCREVIYVRRFRMRNLHHHDIRGKCHLVWVCYLVSRDQRRGANSKGYVEGLPRGQHTIWGSASCRCGTTQEIRSLGRQGLLDAVK